MKADVSLGFVVLEFNVQTIFDAHFHFNRVIAIWRHAIRMYPDVLLLYDVCYPPRDCDSNKISDKTLRVVQGRVIEASSPEFDIDALVTLKLLFHVFEEEFVSLSLSHFSRSC